MGKKLVHKKLQLKKETVRQINNGELGQANGAGIILATFDTCNRTLCNQCQAVGGAPGPHYASGDACKNTSYTYICPETRCY
jgi:hypothetical protein